MTRIHKGEKIVLNEMHVFESSVFRRRRFANQCQNGETRQVVAQD